MREKMSRFDSYMKIKGLNDNRVTAECLLSQGLLSQARKGKSDLGLETINRILNVYTDINRVWLLTGEGEMLKPDSGIHNNKVSNNSGTVTMNNGQHISISLPEAGTQKIISPDGSVQIIPNHSKNNEYLELLREKDKQIERLLSIIENKSK